MIVLEAEVVTKAGLLATCKYGPKSCPKEKLSTSLPLYHAFLAVGSVINRNVAIAQFLEKSVRLRV